jgi:ribosomal protein S27E
MSKRYFERHTRRLETIFTTATDTFKGITSDISEGGLFIRTAYVLAPGSIIGIEIHLPDGQISRLKGRVKRSVRTALLTAKNGMGIEIIEKDLTYINLVRGIKEGDAGSSEQFSILTCQNCGAKNKIRTAHKGLIPKCGKCGNPLIQERKTQLEYLLLMCPNCRAKNKILSEKLSLNPRCGRCGTTLRREDIV